jgi:hypothetical protein
MAMVTPNHDGSMVAIRDLIARSLGEAVEGIGDPTPQSFRHESARFYITSYVQSSPWFAPSRAPAHRAGGASLDEQRLEVEPAAVGFEAEEQLQEAPAEAHHGHRKLTLRVARDEVVDEAPVRRVLVEPASTLPRRRSSPGTFCSSVAET